MVDIEELEIEGYERYLKGFNEKTGNKIELAIYSTKRGPALVGLRLQHFLLSTDASKLCRTAAKKTAYKAAVAGLNYGGGYCILNAAMVTDQIIEDLGTMIEWLNDTGTRAILAVPDFNIGYSVLEKLSEYTAHVVEEYKPQYKADTTFECLKAYQRFTQLSNLSVNIDGLTFESHPLIVMAKEEGWDVCISSSDEEEGLATASYYKTAFAKQEDIQYLSGVYVPMCNRRFLGPTVLSVTDAEAVIGPSLIQIDREDIVDALYNNNIIYLPEIIVGSGDLISAAEYLGNTNTKELIGYAAKQASAIMLAGTANKQNVLTLTNKLAEDIINGEM
jgi:leucine dehydrogenase